MVKVVFMAMDFKKQREVTVYCEKLKLFVVYVQILTFGFDGAEGSVVSRQSSTDTVARFADTAIRSRCSGGWH